MNGIDQLLLQLDKWLRILGKLWNIITGIAISEGEISGDVSSFHMCVHKVWRDENVARRVTLHFQTTSKYTILCVSGCEQ